MKGFDCIAAMKALGEENRLRIVGMLLRREPCRVGEIAEELGLTSYNASKHLRVLREAGLLDQEKEGQHRLYRLAPEITRRIRRNRNVLDLGCCQFDFGQLPG